MARADEAERGGGMRGAAAMAGLTASALRQTSGSVGVRMNGLAAGKKGDWRGVHVYYRTPYGLASAAGRVGVSCARQRSQANVV